MDDGLEEKRSGRLSQREKRWSMNSQRLEEIVAELMKPISDLRHSFDTDLSALLEEYLTEAGLHALDAEGGEEHGATPNFAELALLLQQSASIYGRKVDFLYQHVLSVSDSLQNTTTEINASNLEDETRSSSKRKRKQSMSGEFGGIELELCGGARRETGPPPRPPPTLPRMYVELEPRVLTDSDAPLRDYAGEPIGLLSDFHVTWRLQGGFLVEELKGSGVDSGAALRPVPLLELQAALEAAAPPSPPPAPHEDSPPPDYAPPCSTPLPMNTSHKEMHPPPNKIKRKRKNDNNIDQVFDGNIKILLSKGVRRSLRRTKEFSVNSEWLSSVVSARANKLVRLRMDQPADQTPVFRGFDLSDNTDVEGFCGWSSSELETSRSQTELMLRVGSRLGSQLGTQLGWEGSGETVVADSDDDGFFEQSSLGDSDGSRVDDSVAGGNLSQSSGCELSAELCLWRAGVVSRAAAAAARPPLDVRVLAHTVLATLRPAPAYTPARQLFAAATQPEDVSRLFLATLFLANAGNVEISCGAPLTVDSFSVRVVGDGGGARALRPATPDTEQFLR